MRQQRMKKYESGLFANHVCMGAACVLLSNSAFVQASILVATMTPIIYKFYR